MCGAGDGEDTNKGAFAEIWLQPDKGDYKTYKRFEYYASFPRLNHVGKAKAKRYNGKNKWQKMSV